MSKENDPVYVATECRFVDILEDLHDRYVFGTTNGEVTFRKATTQGIFWGRAIFNDRRLRELVFVQPTIELYSGFQVNSLIVTNIPEFGLSVEEVSESLVDEGNVNRTVAKTDKNIDEKLLAIMSIIKNADTITGTQETTPDLPYCSDEKFQKLERAKEIATAMLYGLGGYSMFGPNWPIIRKKQ